MYQYDLLEHEKWICCTICKTPKPLSEFYERAEMTGGRLRQCKECLKERSARWTKDHPEESKAYAREYYRSHAMQSSRKSLLAYYERIGRPPKWRWDRDKRKALGVSFLPFKAMAKAARRYKIPCTLTTEQFCQLRLMKCTYCDGFLPKTGHGLDRLDNSIGYELTNVVPCCGFCNRIRSNILSPEQMLEIKSFLTKFRLEREKA